MFELEECAWRIGNSKQNEEIDNNHKCQLVYKSPKKVWQWLVRQVNLIDDNIAHRVRCAGRKE